MLWSQFSLNNWDMWTYYRIACVHKLTHAYHVFCRFGTKSRNCTITTVLYKSPLQCQSTEYPNEAIFPMKLCWWTCPVETLWANTHHVSPKSEYKILETSGVLHIWVDRVDVSRCTTMHLPVSCIVKLICPCIGNTAGKFSSLSLLHHHECQRFWKHKQAC